MKKIFTLIAAAMAVMSVSAQEWNASNASDLPKGTTLLDNQYVTITTGVQDSKCANIMNEDGTAISKTAGDYTFTKQTSIRVTDAPSADNNWEGTAYTECTPLGISLIVAPKANVDLTLYYGHGDGKAVSCYDVTASSAVAITETTSGDGYVGVYKFQKDHSYVIYARGGTTSLWGINTAAGTYVEPSNKIYASETAASNADGLSQITYGDGATLVLNKSGKSFGNGSSITVDNQKYTSIKGSNGAQNIFTAPSGKYVTKVTFYSYVNASPISKDTYWSEVYGTAYTTETTTKMASAKDGANPDAISFELGGVSSFTFNNAGTQVCFVMDITYGEPTAIKTVNANEVSSIKKSLVNGQVVIEMNGKKYNAAGAQLK